jgi:hypothetical protein
MVSPPGTVRLEQAFPGGGMIPLAAGVTVLVPQRLADELVGKGQAVVVAEDPDPVLTAITPDAAVIGDPVLTLHCAGSGFSLISVVFFNDAPQPTTFVSPTELTIGVDPATASGPLTVPVHVRNGARESTAFGFTFAEPVEEEL